MVVVPCGVVAVLTVVVTGTSRGVRENPSAYGRTLRVVKNFVYIPMVVGGMNVVCELFWVQDSPNCASSLNLRTSQDFVSLRVV